MAFTSFTPNCTFPSEIVDWVASPPLRSSFDIVWTSLLTIVACTYTILHLDIIADDRVTSRPKRQWWDKRLELRDLTVEVAVAIVAVIAPEWIFCRSGQEYSDVRTSLDQKEQFLPRVHEHGTQWSPSQIHFAKMGGYRLCIENAAESTEELKVYHEFMLTERAFLNVLTRVKGPILLPLTERELGDYSDASTFTKSIATLQIAWFGVNIISRLVRQLPVSPLEAGTSAFALISIWGWVNYFDKPKGVQAGLRLYLQLPEGVKLYVRGDNLPLSWSTGSQLQSGPVEEETTQEKEELPPYLHLQGNTLITNNISSLRKDTNLLQTLTSAHQSQRSRITSLIKEIVTQLYGRTAGDRGAMGGDMLMIAIYAIPFGAVHVAAWNASFPTNIDKWLWRGSALATMFPVLLFILVWILHNLAKVVFDAVFRKKYGMVGAPAYSVVLVMYVVARLVLIGEMVRCVFYLPPGAYVATWSASLPHMG